MIEALTAAWPQIEAKLTEKYTAAAPGSYDAIFADLVEAWPDDEYERRPDPERITTIDHGDYQGTRLFIVAAEGYQPYTFWSCAVSYGSCSGCDAFEAIRDDSYWNDEGPTEQAVKDYVSLARHMLQAVKEV